MELVEKCKSENDFIRNEAMRLEEEHDELIQNNVINLILKYKLN